MSDHRTSYVRDDDGNITHVAHTYDMSNGTRVYVYAYETGLLGLGPDTGSLVVVIDNYEDGASVAHDPGEEGPRW